MIESLYDAATVAMLLGVTTKQVWRWTRSGKLKTYRLGSGRCPRIRIPESALLEFLGAEAENPPWATLSLPTGTVPGASMSRGEALGYLRRALKGRMT